MCSLVLASEGYYLQGPSFFWALKGKTLDMFRWQDPSHWNKLSFCLTGNPSFLGGEGGTRKYLKTTFFVWRWFSHFSALGIFMRVRGYRRVGKLRQVSVGTEGLCAWLVRFPVFVDCMVASPGKTSTNADPLLTPHPTLVHFKVSSGNSTPRNNLNSVVALHPAPCNPSQLPHLPPWAGQS